MTMPAESAHAALDGRFLIVEALGRGGQGRVFRAHDRVHRRDVAIKALHAPEDATRASTSAAEFSAWVRLRHPNVVRAYEMHHARTGPLAPRTPYLVLELVDGAPVHRALRAGAEPPAVLEEVARRLLRALSHVHDAGIVHRDLKPGNVLVTRSRGTLGRVKLTDFGLASESGRSGEPGRISGSIPYVAPETILGLCVDGRADLYGLGVLLFYLATGELPVASTNAEGWLRWHLDGPPADPRRLRASLPARFSELVLRLTARAKDRRPPTCDAALEALGGPAPSVPRSRIARLSPAERARIRLAVDDVRGGASRQLSLSRSDATRAVHVEIATLAASCGMACARLHGPSGRTATSLARAVMTLLLEHGGEARSMIEAHGLDRALPITLLDDVPVWDRARRDARLRGSPRGPARSIAGFIVAAAVRRPVALLVDRSALGDPLTLAVVARLRQRASRRAGPSAYGGLLLAVPA